MSFKSPGSDNSMPRLDTSAFPTPAIAAPYVPLLPGMIERKIDLLMEHFATQRSKDWFHADVFRGLARIRGMECRSPSFFAEAFTARKLAIT